jgi:hypothetical protein
MHTLNVHIANSLVYGQPPVPIRTGQLLRHGPCFQQQTHTSAIPFGSSLVQGQPPVPIRTGQLLRHGPCCQQRTHTHTVPIANSHVQGQHPNPTWSCQLLCHAPCFQQQMHARTVPIANSLVQGQPPVPIRTGQLLRHGPCFQQQTHTSAIPFGSSLVQGQPPIELFCGGQLLCHAPRFQQQMHTCTVPFGSSLVQGQPPDPIRTCQLLRNGPCFQQQMHTRTIPFGSSHVQWQPPTRMKPPLRQKWVENIENTTLALSCSQKVAQCAGIALLHCPVQRGHGDASIPAHRPSQHQAGKDRVPVGWYGCTRNGSVCSGHGGFIHRLQCRDTAVGGGLDVDKQHCPVPRDVDFFGLPQCSSGNVPLIPRLICPNLQPAMCVWIERPPWGNTWSGGDEHNHNHFPGFKRTWIEIHGAPLHRG